MPTLVQKRAGLECGLDAFGHGVQTQAVGKSDQTLGQLDAGLVAVADPGGEGAVELESVDRQVAQTRSR